MPLMAPIPFCCLGMLRHSFDTALLLFLVCIFSCDLACCLKTLHLIICYTIIQDLICMKTSIFLLVSVS